MIELITLNKGVEQNFILVYNDIPYKFYLYFDDYKGEWYTDVYLQSSNELVIAGLYLFVDNNALYGLSYLGIGTTLALVDTTPESDFDINKKNDLGDRLKLYRQV